MASLLLSIADIACTIVDEDGSLTDVPPGSASRFVTSSDVPTITVHASRHDLTAFTPSTKKLFDSGGVWQLYEDDDFTFTFHSTSFGTPPYKVAHVTSDFRRAEVILNTHAFPEGERFYPLEYPLDELLYTHYLATGKGIELHACGLSDGSGDGLLFVGHSGAGKSTMAALWDQRDGVTILSDDRIILRTIHGTVWMYGTPWHGEAGFASSGRARLKRIYILRHGTTNQISPLGKTEAVGCLFSRSFTPLYSPDAVSFTLDFLEKLVASVPCAEFSFVPNEEAVQVLQKT